jgi:transposase
MADLKRKLAASVARYEASREARDAAIREAHAGGLSYRDIGQIVGLSHSRIQQIVGSKHA